VAVVAVVAAAAAPVAPGGRHRVVAEEGGWMPVTYEVDEHQDRVLVHVTEEVSITDFNDLRARLQLDEAARVRAAVLVDLRDVTGFDLTARQLTSFAADRSAPLEPGQKIAIVAPPGEGFGLSRLYQMSRGETPEHIRVFADLAAAEAWIAAPQGKKGEPSAST